MDVVGRTNFPCNRAPVILIDFQFAPGKQFRSGAEMQHHPLMNHHHHHHHHHQQQQQQQHHHHRADPGVVHVVGGMGSQSHRSSRGSDTSSAYSGSDTMHSSVPSSDQVKKSPCFSKMADIL